MHRVIGRAREKERETEDNERCLVESKIDYRDKETDKVR